MDSRHDAEHQTVCSHEGFGPHFQHDIPPKSALSSLLPVPTEITFWRRILYSDAVMNPPAYIQQDDSLKRARTWAPVPQAFWQRPALKTARADKENRAGVCCTTCRDFLGSFADLLNLGLRNAFDVAQCLLRLHLHTLQCGQQCGSDASLKYFAWEAVQRVNNI